jgi:YD repeat-containing protein
LPQVKIFSKAIHFDWLIALLAIFSLTSTVTAAGFCPPPGYPQAVAEVVTGQPVRTYTYGLERISELQTVNNAPTVSFYQYDGRGTVRMLTNSAGAVTDSYEYDAFGNLISKSGTTPNAYLYRGERYDTSASTTCARAGTTRPPAGS